MCLELIKIDIHRQVNSLTIKATLNPNIDKLPVRQRIAEYIGLFLASTLHLLVFSFWTSPFYKLWYGCDASFFTLVGRGITEGKVPYRDFFDLKGPYFFFIEALGQLLAKSRLGAFIIQVPFAFASLVLVYEISLLFISKKKSLFVCAVYLWGNITTLWGGNTLEEFILPLSLACLYIVLRKIVNENMSLNELPLTYMTVLGAAVGICLFSKISCGAPVLGIIAAVIFSDLTDKNIKHLLVNLLYLAFGLALSALPVIIYFGANSALNEMFFCVFKLGFSRSTNYYESFNITWELKLSGAVLAFMFAILARARINRNISIILMAMSAATWLLLHLGTPYFYYFTTVYPCLILAIALFLKIYNPIILFEDACQVVTICLFAIFLFYYVPTGLDSINTASADRSFYSAEQFQQDAEDMGSLIPSYERDSVFSFMLDMQWFEANQITPCCRYVVNVPFFIELYPQAQTDILDMLDNNPPKWIVIGNDFVESLPEISQVVLDRYTCIYENSSGHLFLFDENHEHKSVIDEEIQNFRLAE